MSEVEKQDVDKKIFDGLLPLPPTQNTILAKLLVRIAQLISNYSELALKDVDVKQLDDFIFLTTIADLKDPRRQR